MPPYTIFLSYSRLDHAEADMVYQKLTTEWRFNVWMDKHDMLPGDHWSAKTMRQLEQSGAVLIIVTSNFLHAQGYVREELYRALTQSRKNKLRIIPVLFSGASLPLELRNYHSVRWYDAAEREQLHSALLAFRTRQRKRRWQMLLALVTLPLLLIMAVYYHNNSVSDTEAGRLQRTYDSLTNTPNALPDAGNTVKPKHTATTAARFDAVVIDGITGKPLRGATARAMYNAVEYIPGKTVADENGHVRLNIDTVPGVRMYFYIECPGYKAHKGRYEVKADYFSRTIALLPE
jgi:hypothetical protein